MQVTKNVVEYLERSTHRNPDACAVIDEHESISYAKLLELSQRAATALAKAKAARTGVVLLMEKSARMLAIMMGALASGAFYVPVDPQLPAARLQKILTRVGAALVVAEGENAAHEAAAALGIDVLAPQDLLAHEIDHEFLRAARKACQETDPAYVLFTSGSTGEPKGVAISHRAIASFIESFTASFELSSRDRFGNQAPFDFDVSTKDIYSALSLGATLVIIPRPLFMKPLELIAYLEKHEVSVLVWAVAALGIVSAYHALDEAKLTSLRLVMFSGEVMPRRHLADWRNHLPKASFVNLYGPTEITCNCLYHTLDPARSYEEGIPLGKAFSHCRVYLIAEDGTEVTASGEKGEIAVSGPSLSLGYVGMAQETAHAFVQNPLSSVFPETVYRTGDLGQYSEAGEMFFAGRKDNQIKFQGHRIELEEIDLAFEALPGVSRCRSVFDERGKRLRAFYEGTASREQLLEAVRTELPSHMRPASIEQVETMPLNNHGKVDRSKLLEQWKRMRRARRKAGSTR